MKRNKKQYFLDIETVSEIANHLRVDADKAWEYWCNTTKYEYLRDQNNEAYKKHLQLWDLLHMVYDKTLPF
jgi:hypothetical protein